MTMPTEIRERLERETAAEALFRRQFAARLHRAEVIRESDRRNRDRREARLGARRGRR